MSTATAPVRHDGFTEASVRGASRVRQLTLAARLLHEGHLPEMGWVAVQLLDLRDLIRPLESGG
ncbi:MAG: hypothetical protein ACRDQU_06715 [Pseudonocardiaceae bacterium]